jgi:hypothetical protein
MCCHHFRILHSPIHISVLISFHSQKIGKPSINFSFVRRDSQSFTVHVYFRKSAKHGAGRDASAGASGTPPSL